MLTEKQLHKQICDYLHHQYPKVLFNTDMSGIKLTQGQAKQAKELRSGNGFPDINIFSPIYGFRHDDIKYYSYCGLKLEVKKETPYRKDGVLKKMVRTETINGIKVEYDHLQRQNAMHVKLRELGFFVQFVWTFDMAKRLIDDYLDCML